MNDKYLKENSSIITLRLSNDLLEEIKNMSIQSERNLSEQIRYMLKKYIEIQK